jgi:regulatory protein
LDKVTASGTQRERSLNIDSENIANKQANGSMESCFKAATIFLSYRPRSEYELKQRLMRRGFDVDCINDVLQRLKENGLVDDTLFAKFWIENREAFSPRSRRLTGLELRRKGVPAEVVSDVTETIDDEDYAYRAALRKSRGLTLSESNSQRLGEFLKRRGFSYSVIDHTLKRLEREQKTE